MSSWSRRVAFLGAILAPSVLVAACILADAPPTIEVPPPQRPVIVNAAVVPALGDTIDDPRALDFAVPVEVDSDQTLRWLVLVDFNPLVDQPPGASAIEPTPGFSRRTIEFNYLSGEQLDHSTCHKIELVVALDFDRNTTYSPKTPPGGDKVKWLYQPRGVSCLAYDAGPLPEAGSDASDAGDASDGGTQ